MLAGLTGFHLFVIVAVIVVIFGAAKLPVLARSLGQSVRIMRGELRSAQEQEQTAQQPVAVAAGSTPEAAGPVR